MNKRIFVTAKSVAGICILAALTTQSARAGQLVLTPEFKYSYRYEYSIGGKAMYPGDRIWVPGFEMHPPFVINNAKLTPSVCAGSVTTRAGDGLPNPPVTSSVSCGTYTNGGFVMSPLRYEAPRRQNGYANYSVQGAGIYEFNTEHDAVDLIACLSPGGQFIANGGGTNQVSFTSPDGKVYTGTVSAGCRTLFRLPATNSPSGALTLNYEDQITANAKPDGSFEHRLLSLDNSTRGSLKLNMSATSAQGAIASARLVKANGAPCDTISAGETCSFSLPPGSVGVGQTLQGNITVNVSVI
ncbi:hypothetical protein AAP82_004698 [Salmonella enterica subsp. enterica]|nr:hypothetical protein [Salmonella enterica subsp. enterica]EDR7631601.1 hypothetical protein [Salmonella enterica subsp. enterica]